MYWVIEREVEDRLSGRSRRGWLFGWRRISGSEKKRTIVASVMPRSAVGDSTFLVISDRAELPFLSAGMSSYVLDYVARLKMGGTNTSYFIMKQLPIPDPSDFGQTCEWDRECETVEWMRPRIAELSYTAWDLGSYGRELGFACPPFKWNPTRRILLRCELDAAFFHLYGIERDDVDYIMETFPIVKRKDIAEHGDYRTKLTILDIYDRMQQAIDTGNPYQTLLEPPPADASLAHRTSAQALKMPDTRATDT